MDGLSAGHCFCQSWSSMASPSICQNLSVGHPSQLSPTSLSHGDCWWWKSAGELEDSCDWFCWLLQCQWLSTHSCSCTWSSNFSSRQLGEIITRLLYSSGRLCFRESLLVLSGMSGSFCYRGPSGHKSSQWTFHHFWVSIHTGQSCLPWHDWLCHIGHIAAIWLLSMCVVLTFGRTRHTSLPRCLAIVQRLSQSCIATSDFGLWHMPHTGQESCRWTSYP